MSIRKKMIDRHQNANRENRAYLKYIYNDISSFIFARQNKSIVCVCVYTFKSTFVINKAYESEKKHSDSCLYFIMLCNPKNSQ